MINPKYNPLNLTIRTYDYAECFKKEDKESADIPTILPLEGDEEMVMKKQESKS